MLPEFTPDERTFIRNHLTDDVRTLLLRAHPPGIDIRKLAAQLSARQKAREKMPTWYANDDVIFPGALSVEQASSEQTARFKASLVSGEQLVDLTGGMGVDTWAFTQRVASVVYIERQPELAQLTAHNLPALGIYNVTVQTGDSLDFLSQSANSAPVDWVYLDPHRRNEQGGRVVQLTDCEPDVSSPQIREQFRKLAKQVLLKTSPLLDINAAIRQLERVKSVYVVAVDGEVKEVLFMLDKQLFTKDTVQLNAVNLVGDTIQIIQFTGEQERTASVTFGNPQRYLYEPNAAVLKAGGFRFVAQEFGLTKLAPNSHLYTSDHLLPDFPGRTFLVTDVVKAEAKSLKTVLPTMQANLTVRNFPQTVAELRKRLQLREGGDVYLFATTLLNTDKRLIVCRKAAPGASETNAV